MCCVCGASVRSGWLAHVLQVMEMLLWWLAVAQAAVSASIQPVAGAASAEAIQTTVAVAVHTAHSDGRAQWCDTAADAIVAVFLAGHCICSVSPRAPGQLCHAVWVDGTASGANVRRQCSGNRGWNGKILCVTPLRVDPTAPRLVRQVKHI